MRPVAIVTICAMLGGCQTTGAPQVIYVRIDGKPISGPLQQAFDTDKTICLGEMSKANMAGAVIPTGNVFMDVSNDIDRSKGANSVMLGCMAQHGYKLVAVPPPGS